MTILLYSSFLWAIFLLLYLILFRKETFFKLNRAYLIGTLLLGLLLPMLSLAPALFTINTSVQYETTTLALQEISIDDIIPIAAVKTNASEAGTSLVFLDPLKLLILLYGFVLMVLVGRLFLGMRRLRHLCKSYGREKIEDIYIVRHSEKMNPFSFWNTIYINPELSSEGLSIILQHESAHLRQRHSLDLILSTILKLVFWWHPLIHLYDKLIKENHEFLADAYSTDQKSKTSYIKLLVGLPFAHPPFVHPLITSPLKKRIEMLLKEKSSAAKSARYFLLLPILLGMAFFFSCQSQMDTSSYEVGAAVEALIQKSELGDDRVGRVFDGYRDLEKSYPNHLPYIQSRLSEYFSSLGMELTFSEEGVCSTKKVDGIQNLDEQIIGNFPTLVPISKSALKKTVNPGPRMHPIKKIKTEHKGTDFVADLGTPVHAAGGGVVTKVKDYDRGYGKNITIDHGSEIESFYAHLSVVSVEVGDKVSKGTKIGEVGITGLATTPHLHFELRREGELWNYEVLTQTLE